jgi:hypothetical protein
VENRHLREKGREREKKREKELQSVHNGTNLQMSQCEQVL